MLGFGLGLNKWRRVGGGYVGLLDLFPNAAAAYSLRLLRKDYSGGLVRARAWDGSANQGEADVMAYRVSATEYVLDLNSTLENLDATAISRGLTTSDTLADLVSTGVNDYDGLTSAWYDQSLSNDATQGTAANQPKIVSGGSLVTIDGYACLDGDLGAGDTMMQASNVIDSVGDVAIFSTYALKTDGAAANQITFEIGNGTSTHRIHDTLGRDAAGTFGIDIRGAINYDFGNATGVAVDDIYLNSILSEANGFYINGTQQTSDNTVRSGSTVDALTLFNRGSGSFPYKGKFFEFIFFASDQSANRTGIEANINTFYSIYP